MYFIMFRYNKSSNNRNKASNILTKALNNLYNKLERRNLNIIASILIKIIELSFKILK